MRIFLGYLLTYIWIFLILGVTMALKKKSGAADETTRKIVHISVSLAWIIMVACFGTTWHLLIPPFTFIILNYASYKKDIFSGMERDQKDVASLGTVWYAVSMTVLAALSLLDSRFLPAYGIGLFCMAFGDGLAPMFGKLKKGNFFIIKGKRSFYGSLAVFAVSIIVCAVMTAVFSLPLTWYEIGIVGLAAAVLEIVGLKGLDNLTLPIGTAVISWLFIAF